MDPATQQSVERKNKLFLSAKEALDWLIFRAESLNYTLKEAEDKHKGIASKKFREQ